MIDSLGPNVSERADEHLLFGTLASLEHLFNALKQISPRVLHVGSVGELLVANEQVSSVQRG